MSERETTTAFALQVLGAELHDVLPTTSRLARFQAMCDAVEAGELTEEELAADQVAYLRARLAGEA